MDLFACSMLGHPEGVEVFDMIEKLTNVNFAASTDKTGKIYMSHSYMIDYACKYGYLYVHHTIYTYAFIFKFMSLYNYMLYTCVLFMRISNGRRLENCCCGYGLVEIGWRNVAVVKVWWTSAGEMLLWLRFG